MKRELFAATRLSTLLYPICTACQIAGAGLMMSLPWSLRWFLNYRFGVVEPLSYWSMLVLLLVSGVSAFVILIHAKAVLAGIRAQNPFTMETARHTEAIALWCLPIAGIYLAGVALLASAFVLLVGIAFLFLAVFIHIVAQLFYEAARYKQENDLTI